jgi:hypothetical protein
MLATLAPWDNATLSPENWQVIIHTAASTILSVLALILLAIKDPNAVGHELSCQSHIPPDSN